MKKLFAILLILVCFGAYSQSYDPTGPGWKYTPKIQSDDLQVKTLFKLNGETIKFQSPTDGQVIQRVLKDGQHIWTNKTLSSFMYDSLKFNKLTGIISLYKNGFVAISDTLDGRYALIEDIPTVPTSIWELTGINRTGWEEGKLVKFDSSGNLVVGSTTGASGIGLADLHATAPILYNSTTGTFSFSGETDPNVYSWAKASTKPGYSWSEISSKPTFATVATTGSYTDLINKPTIPAAQVNSDWNATTGVAKILNKPTLVDSIYIVKDTVNNINYVNYSIGGTVYNITSNAIPEGIVSGGKVTRIDSLKFDVTPATYYISENLYTTSRDTVILDDPDATNPRIDIIGVDTTGVVIVIKGTPNANPQKPSINPLSQVELTQVLVMKDSVAVDVTPESYDYWGIGVNNGAARLIKSREVLKLHGFDEGIEVSRIDNNIYFKADTTFLASLHALNDTAQAIRNDFPIVSTDTLFTTIAISDETTALTTGTAKRTFRMPVGCTLVKVRASVNTAPVGATLIFDINEGGTSVLSTKLSIDASEKTSKTAASQAVISDSAIADDAEMTIDIDQVGSSTAGAGAKIILYYLKN